MALLERNYVIEPIEDQESITDQPLYQDAKWLVDQILAFPLPPKERFNVRIQLSIIHDVMLQAQRIYTDDLITKYYRTRATLERIYAELQVEKPLDDEKPVDDEKLLDS